MLLFWNMMTVRFWFYIFALVTTKLHVRNIGNVLNRIIFVKINVFLNYISNNRSLSDNNIIQWIVEIILFARVLSDRNSTNVRSRDPVVSANVMFINQQREFAISDARKL